MAKKVSAEEQRRRAAMMEFVREMGITHASELWDAMRDMFAGTLEDMLKAELDEHLGYEKHDQSAKETENRRNGTTPKQVRLREGKTELQVPRDREGSFDPQVVKKGENDISQLQEKVMSMYAKGMSDRDISAIVEDIYGFSVSHETISRIVERIQPRFMAWQSRELEAVYAFVYVDAIVVKVKQEGKARNKAVYTVVGIDMEGHKDILGLWMSENEGAHTWMMVFDELKARGVQFRPTPPLPPVSPLSGRRVSKRAHRLPHHRAFTLRERSGIPLVPRIHAKSIAFVNSTFPARLPIAKHFPFRYNGRCMIKHLNGAFA